MTHPKRDKLSSTNKDTRWDRIRKRHCTNVATNLKSNTVKKLIEIDYIGRHQKNMLNGDADLDINLNPVLVMNLRHEMFKKIPRKLPLATVAYSKNLQQCRNHNIAVEDHYIDNQLNHFRKQLQKQNERNKVPLKKLNSLLIDNSDIMKSLESTHKHIEDFYNAPIDALQEVNDLFETEIKKHIKMIDEENWNNNTRNHLQNHLEYNNEDINLTADGINELNLNGEILEQQSPIEKNLQRTPSPLENTDEVLQPLRQALEDPSCLQLRFVRFDDTIDICPLKKEDSICSNTSDGIESVISDLAEEALRELEMEEDAKIVEILEVNNLDINENKQNLNLNGCPLHMDKEREHELHVTGTVVPYGKAALKDHIKINHSINSAEEIQNENYLNNEQSKIINDLFESHVDDKTSIKRKYFLKWVHYTTIEKIEREHVDSRADRMKKINIFLDKVRIQKKRLKNYQKTANDLVAKNDYKKYESIGERTENVKINKKYQNKIKVQQDIIDLQRLKLERQERIIMELKLHKLSEETKEARQELKNELKSVIRSGDPKSKAKAKCLQIIGSLKDEEAESLNKLQGKSLLLPKFMQNMQERALERCVRHEQAKQRRMQQEAEREAQKLALEEAKRLEDEEGKRLRIEVLKEKRRQEKIAKIIRERERQKYVENQRKAQEFYKYSLLKRIGMAGFKRLLQRKRDNLKKCEELRRSLYKKTYFQAWFSLHRILTARRNQKADELYEKCLKQKCIHIWFDYICEQRSKFNVAVDYNEFKITESMFRKWWAYEKRMQMIEETKMKQATSHHEWHLKWKVLDCWQRLPQILQLEKETEERRQRWRLKIWELLPDYTPNRDEFNYI